MRKTKPGSVKGGRAAAAKFREREKLGLAKYSKEFQRYLQSSTSEIKSLERRRVRGW